MAAHIIFLVNRRGKRAIQWSGMLRVAGLVFAFWALIAIGFCWVALGRMPSLNESVLLAGTYVLSFGALLGPAFSVPVDRLPKAD
jgi:hypothetical protein